MGKERCRVCVGVIEEKLCKRHVLSRGGLARDHRRSTDG